MKLQGKDRTDEILANWPQSFYEIDDINEREQVLLQRMESLNDAEDTERYRIFQLRFEEAKGDKRPDRFMRAWMLIPVAFQNANSFFGKKAAEKEIRQYYKDLCVSEEEPSEYIKAEWKAFADKLIFACATDKQYGSAFFGLGHISDASIARKILSEIHNITYVVPSQYGFVDACKPLRNILLNSYVQLIPNGHSYLSEYETD